MGRIPNEKAYKLAPKLRMIANGNDVVNALRAERAADITVVDDQLLEEINLQREVTDHPIRREDLPPEVTRGSLEKIPDSVVANVFIRLVDGVEALPEAIRDQEGASRPMRKGDLVAATVPLNRLPALLTDPSVIAVEDAEQVLFIPSLEVSYHVEEPVPKSRDFSEPYTDSNPGAAEPSVLVGIVDVQGFDFAHPDFLDKDGNTRFVRIWDQGGDSRLPPRHFRYGAEITDKMMNTAINKSKDPRFGLNPTLLKPQSQMAPSSHATHVASIAAGNRGVCPEALIAGVLISLPREDTDRRKSFYDSTRLAHAIDYLFQLGRQLKLPVSINVSLGTNGHAHDASSLTSRWIDYELATPGRSVCVAAGNAGQESPTEPGDWGYMMGRIHSSGNISKTDGQSIDLFWQVVGDGIADLSENELEIWYSPGDHFAVQVKPPGEDWIGPVKPGEFIENMELPSGTFLSVYNEFYSPSNGCNYIACYLSPFFSKAGVVGVSAGTWIVRLIAQDLRDGDFHAWIERDDPRRLGRIGMIEAWAFPSFFSIQSNVDNTSVSSLACGNYVIGVANLDEHNQRIHVTSSQGPTRDGRYKPDIAAPGTRIIAANGFDPSRRWVEMTGTSMAGPYVAGVIARMLAIDPNLTAAQIGGILRRTAIPLPGAGFNWSDDAGFGRIDPDGCLKEVGRFRNRVA